MRKYKAVLFAKDGDWVTDCKGNTMEEVWEQVANLGSRWFFYPIVLTIIDHGSFTTARQRIVHVPEELSFMGWQGLSIKSVGKDIENLTDDQFLSLIGG